MANPNTLKAMIGQLGLARFEFCSVVGIQILQRSFQMLMVWSTLVQIIIGVSAAHATPPNREDFADANNALVSYKTSLPNRGIPSLGFRPTVPSMTVDPIGFNEPNDVGWQLYFDNDLFSGSKKDRDYTGGFALAYSGRRARDWWFSMNSWLNFTDELTGMRERKLAPGGFLRHTLEFGLVLLTPDNIKTHEPQLEDRPFANFLFMANSQQVTFPDKRLTLQSALTVGLIGTDAGPAVQSLIHKAVGSDQAGGWSNQISDGGELTGKYSVIAQKNLLQRYRRFSYELSGAVEANIGFNTDIAVSVTTRFGRLRSPWWSFAPFQSDYINLGQAMTSRIDKRVMPAEIFGWAGIKTKYSIYNGFLQGQFRDSRVKFDSSELNQGVVEAWIGATVSWRSGMGLSFFIRNRTAEIKGLFSRDAVWSGFIVSFASSR